jgi:hypothetical protein
MENAEANQSRRKSRRVDAVTNSGTEDRQSIRQGKTLFFSILCSLLIGGLAVTNQSLWIDEASSAVKAVQPSLASWWTTFVAEKGSDLQMPFYMFYLWAWCKVFGTSEIALRAANLPWFAAGVCALLWGFAGNRRLQLATTAFTLIHAFLWYYISEARPYIVLFAFSALSAACLFRLRDNQKSSIQSPLWFRFFCLGTVGLCATNLIAVPWALAAIGAFIFWIGPWLALQTARQFIWSVALTACALITLAVFYFWTLRLGARASDVGRTEFATLGFVLYELAGISGLGRGRLALRAAGVPAFAPYAWSVGAGIVAVFSLCAVGISELLTKITRRDFLFFGIAVGIPSAVLIAAGVCAHVRILGRHFTPGLPFILAFLAIGFERLFFVGRAWRQVIGLFVMSAMLTSAFEIRFAPRHQRDDYRSAATEARRAIALGEKVWWAADDSTAVYYGVPLNSSDLFNTAFLHRIDLETLEQPDLIILSKPDIYDPNGKISAYLSRHNFRMTSELPAFQLWRNPSAHPGPR